MASLLASCAVLGLMGCTTTGRALRNGPEVQALPRTLSMSPWGVQLDGQSSARGRYDEVLAEVRQVIRGEIRNEDGQQLYLFWYAHGRGGGVIVPPLLSARTDRYTVGLGGLITAGWITMIQDERGRPIGYRDHGYHGLGSFGWCTEYLLVEDPDLEGVRRIRTLKVFGLPVSSESSLLAFREGAAPALEPAPPMQPAPAVPAIPVPPVAAAVQVPEQAKPLAPNPTWRIIAASDSDTPGAQADAETFSRRMTENAAAAGAVSRGNHLTLDAARPDAILAALGALAAETSPDHHVLLLIAGHGSAEQVDGRLEAGVMLNGSVLRLADLGEALRKLPSPSVVVLDIGFTEGPRGPATNGGPRLSETDLTRCFDLARTTLVTSAPDNDVVLDAEGQHGLLSAMVIDSPAGADKNGDGWVALDELSGYLSMKVSREAYLRASRYQFPLVRGPAGARLWPAAAASR